jgi:hypothetical protein
MPLYLQTHTKMIPRALNTRTSIAVVLGLTSLSYSSYSSSSFSEMCGATVEQKYTDVSEEGTASILRVRNLCN